MLFPTPRQAKKMSVDPVVYHRGLGEFSNKLTPGLYNCGTGLTYWEKQVQKIFDADKTINTVEVLFDGKKTSSQYLLCGDTCSPAGVAVIQRGNTGAGQRFDYYPHGKYTGRHRPTAAKKSSE